MNKDANVCIALRWGLADMKQTEDFGETAVANIEIGS
jgi:hypothetical protein